MKSEILISLGPVRVNMNDRELFHPPPPPQKKKKKKKKKKRTLIFLIPFTPNSKAFLFLFASHDLLQEKITELARPSYGYFANNL